MIRNLLLSFSCLLLLACGKTEPPPASIELLEGNVLHQRDWEGKWVYINYWAEWCKPCAEEIPELNKFSVQAQDVLLLGVHFDKPSVNDTLRHANALRINFAVAVSDLQAIFKYPMPQGLPATIVINPQGEVVTTLQGPQTVESLMAAKR